MNAIYLVLCLLNSTHGLRKALSLEAFAKPAKGSGWGGGNRWSRGQRDRSESREPDAAGLWGAACWRVGRHTEKVSAEGFIG